MQRPSSSGLLAGLFSLAVFLMPFSSIHGFDFFGEMWMEAGFYVFMPLLLLFGLSRLVIKTPWQSMDSAYIRFIICVTLALAVTFCLRIDDIFANHLRGRSGINKFSTSLLVLYFGIAISWCTAWLARVIPGFIIHCVMRPTIAVMLIVIVVGLIELGSWWWDEWLYIYDFLSGILRSNPLSTYYPGRLRSITFEPPFLGMYLSGALLMIGAYIYLMPNFAFSRIWAKLVFLLGAILLLLTGARTALVIISAFFCFYFLFHPSRHRSSSVFPIIIVIFFGLIGGIFYLVQTHHEMTAWIVAGDSISNLSRYASNTAAMNIFSEHPIIGVGLGQYAFYAVDTMPPWGWLSYEIQEWFHQDDAAWPPVFSAPARLAAEGGLIMLLAWYGSLAAMLVKMMRKIEVITQRDGRIPLIGYGLALSMIFALSIGVAFDSFRNFWVWIFLGLSSAYMAMEDPEGHFRDSR